VAPVPSRGIQDDGTQAWSLEAGDVGRRASRATDQHNADLRRWLRANKLVPLGYFPLEGEGATWPPCPHGGFEMMERQLGRSKQMALGGERPVRQTNTLPTFVTGFERTSWLPWGISPSRARGPRGPRALTGDSRRWNASLVARSKRRWEESVPRDRPTQCRPSSLASS
jgi:hypothetical protein